MYLRFTNKNYKKNNYERYLLKNNILNLYKS